MDQLSLRHLFWERALILQDQEWPANCPDQVDVLHGVHEPSLKVIWSASCQSLLVPSYFGNPARNRELHDVWHLAVRLAHNYGSESQLINRWEILQHRWTRCCIPLSTGYLIQAQDSKRCANLLQIRLFWKPGLGVNKRPDSRCFAQTRSSWSQTW